MGLAQHEAVLFEETARVRRTREGANATRTRAEDPERPWGHVVEEVSIR